MKIARGRRPIHGGISVGASFVLGAAVLVGCGADHSERSPQVLSADSDHAQPVTRASAAVSGTTTPAGTTGESTMRVVALGDSVPSGYGSTKTSYVDTVTKRLAAQSHQKAELANYSVDGEGADGVLKDLTLRDEQRDIRQADVVIVEVGANDLDESDAQDPSCAPARTSGCYDENVQTIRTNVGNVLRRVNALARADAQVVVLGYWNVFKDGDAGQAEGKQYLAQGRAVTQWVNELIKQDAQAAGATYVDIYTPFARFGNIQKLLQSDGDHPSTAGHELIAQTVLDALRHPMK